MCQNSNLLAFTNTYSYRVTLIPDPLFLSLFLFYFLFLFLIYFLFFSAMLYKSYIHTRFHLDYCTFSIVIVCYFVRFLMAFVCHEIRGLLTYLITHTRAR